MINKNVACPVYVTSANPLKESWVSAPLLEVLQDHLLLAQTLHSQNLLGKIRHSPVHIGLLHLDQKTKK